MGRDQLFQRWWSRQATAPTVTWQPAEKPPMYDIHTARAPRTDRWFFYAGIGGPDSLCGEGGLLSLMFECYAHAEQRWMPLVMPMTHGDTVRLMGAWDHHPTEAEKRETLPPHMLEVFDG